AAGERRVVERRGTGPHDRGGAGHASLSAAAAHANLCGPAGVQAARQAQTARSQGGASSPSALGGRYGVGVLACQAPLLLCAMWSRREVSPGMKRPQDEVTLSPEEGEALIERLERNALSAADRHLLVQVVR